MSFINHATREVHFKIVYCGPAWAGKTTNLQWVHHRAPQDAKSKLIRGPAETDHVLFFEFRFGAVRGYDCRLHLYTLPGVVPGNEPQVRLLKGVDGIVFVADSQKDRTYANVESLESLAPNLATNGNNLAEIPMVLQYNQRDRSWISSVADLDAALNVAGRMRFEANALQGVGVGETLKAITKQVLQKLSVA